MKVLLTKMTAFLPLEEQEVKTSESELKIARELLEMGARFSVAKMAHGHRDDSEEFDRYIAQLKHYYFDLKYFRKILQFDENLGRNG